MTQEPIQGPLLLVIDTETGGLDPEDRCIVELAAQLWEVRPDGSSAYLVRRSPLFHKYVLPYMPVAPQAAEINGYSEQAWAARGAVPIEVAMTEFLTFTDMLPGQGIQWTGSNVSGFDLPFLRAAAKHCGMTFPGRPKFTHRTVNTESLCFPLFLWGHVDSCGIASLRRWAGLKGEQHHTAAGDVLDTIDVIRRWIEVVGSEEAEGWSGA